MILFEHIKSGICTLSIDASISIISSFTLNVF